MPLELRYRINEGIPVSEYTRDGRPLKSIEVIVRDIDLFPEGVKVNFELLDSNGNSELIRLRENERYYVTPSCALHLPVDPLRRNLPRYPLSRKSSPRKDKVFLKFYAPQEVEFGKRKMYD